MPNRPKFLNLLQIRLPLPAVVSIMHRVSGAVLFLALPLLLWCFQQSLTSPQSYWNIKSALTHGFVKLVFIALLWGYLHHLCAGIRHLLLDVDVGADLAGARLSSKLVLAVSIFLTIFCGAVIW